MTAPSLILKPPRAFQVVIFVAIGEDARSDTELGTYILDHLTASLHFAQSIKGAVVQPIAAIPTGVRPQ